jgi:hypothetical protein
VDSAGNLYIADTGNNLIRKVSAPTGVITTVAGTESFGNYGDNIPATSTELSSPQGVVVDSAGNLYIADTNSSCIRVVSVASPPLSFLPSNYDSTPQTIELANIGNAPLNLSGITPSANFATDGSATTCSTSSPLAAGDSCVVGLLFSPTTLGSFSGTLTLTDNALNAAGSTQQVNLYGTGQGTTSITFQLITPYPPSYGETATLTVNVVAPAGPATPLSGSVTFTIDGNSQPPVPVTNGFARVQLSGLTAGLHRASASYGGSPDGTYLPSSSSTSFTIAQAQTTLSWTCGGTSSQVYGIPIGTGVLNAYAIGGIVGTVSYTETPHPGVQPTPITPATVLPVGSYLLTATLTPTDTVDYSSASGSVSYSVTKGTTAALQASAVNLTPHGNVQLTATVTSSANSGSMPSGTVTFYAGGNPIGSSGLTPNGSALRAVTTVNASQLVLGTNSLTAVYSGDASYSGSTSTATSVFVDPAGSFGSVAVGQAAAQAVSIGFSQTFTIGGINVLTQGAVNQDFTDAGGDSCVVEQTYNPGDSCTVNVRFQPTRAGLRAGAVVLTAQSGSAVAASYMCGIGQGSVLALDPGVESTIDSDLSNPQGMAFDGSGNLYVADSSNHQVVRVPNENGTLNPADQTTVGQGLLNPTGVAVDGAGTVYIADAGTNGANGQLVAIGNNNQLVLVNGGQPQAVAVDNAGNLYFASPVQVNEIPNENGAPNPADQSAVLTGLTNATGLALDAANNLYVADAGNLSSGNNGEVIRVAWVACALSGNAVIMTSGTGTCGLTASQTGNSNYSAATSLSQSVTAQKANSTIAITSASSNPFVVGQSVQVGFQVAGNGTPTGPVTLSATTGESCVGSPAAGGCSLTFNTSGTRMLSASYGGDGNFNPAASGPVNQAVSDFVISATPASQMITPGESAVYAISVASVNGLSGNISLGCSGGPASSTCSVTPASVTLNGTATATATATFVSPANNSGYGTYPIVIAGSLGALTRTAGASLTVANVAVSSPLPNSTVGTTVQFVASAASNSPTAPIKMVKIYVDNVAKYSLSAASINATPKLNTGSHHISVQAWDTLNTVFQSTFSITVQSSTQAYSRWYASNSFWNIPIAASPTIDPNSSNMIAYAISAYASNAVLSNDNNWGISYVYASSTSKTYTVACTVYCTGDTIKFPVSRSAYRDHHQRMGS